MAHMQAVLINFIDVFSIHRLIDCLAFFRAPRNHVDLRVKSIVSFGKHMQVKKFSKRLRSMSLHKFNNHRIPLSIESYASRVQNVSIGREEICAIADPLFFTSVGAKVDIVGDSLFGLSVNCLVVISSRSILLAAATLK